MKVPAIFRAAALVTWRDARRVDLDQIALLEALSFPIPWKREHFEGELAYPGRYSRVALNGQGIVVAYIFCSYAADELHINKICVSEAWRRLGLALHMMDELLAFARSRSLAEAYLEVRPSNEGARVFYEQLSFRTTGRRAGYYADGEDALVMSRRI